MKRMTIAGLSVAVLMTLVTGLLLTQDIKMTGAHCQIPCGIYDDPARIAELNEDAVTIEKAVMNIQMLADKQDALSANQLARWVAAKEDHASHIIEIVSTYFMLQRVKPVAPDQDGYDAYLKNLAEHHAVMVAAMKTKQNPDPALVSSLKDAILTLSHHYMSHN